MPLYRTILLGVLLLLACTLSFAQQGMDDPTAVKLREAIDQRNVLVVKEYTALGDLTAEFGTQVSLQTMVVTTGDKTEPVKGVVITITQAAQDTPQEDNGLIAARQTALDSGDTVYAYLDLDEVQQLSAAIPQLIDKADAWTNVKAERAADYTTRDDFTVSISQNADGEQITTLTAFDGDTAMAFFKSPQHLLTLKGYLDKAVKMLTK